MNVVVDCSSGLRQVTMYNIFVAYYYIVAIVVIINIRNCGVIYNMFPNVIIVISSIVSLL